MPEKADDTLIHLSGCSYLSIDDGRKMAEREGFEPSMGYKPMPVFKTGAFNRSATSPQQKRVVFQCIKAWPGRGQQQNKKIRPLIFSSKKGTVIALP